MSWPSYLLGLATVPVIVGAYWAVGALRYHLLFHLTIDRTGWKEGVEPRLVSITLAPYIGVVFRSGHRFVYHPTGWSKRTLYLPSPWVARDGWPARFHLLPIRKARP